MPLFQHRHYTALAKAISDASDLAEAKPIVDALADLFAADNRQFDRERFRAACAGQPTPKDARSMSAPAPRARLYWVATTGRDGLDVTFQRSEGEWLKTILDVEKGQRAGQYDQIVTDWEDA